MSHHQKSHTPRAYRWRRAAAALVAATLAFSVVPATVSHAATSDSPFTLIAYDEVTVITGGKASSFGAIYNRDGQIKARTGETMTAMQYFLSPVGTEEVLSSWLDKGHRHEVATVDTLSTITFRDLKGWRNSSYDGKYSFGVTLFDGDKIVGQHFTTIDFNKADGTFTVVSGEQAATVPDAPTGVTVGATTAKAVDLSWTAPAKDGGKPVTAYTVNVYEAGATTPTSTVPVTGGTTTTVSNLKPATAYSFGVTATNEIGASAESARATATTAAAPAVEENANIDLGTTIEQATDVGGLTWVVENGGKKVALGDAVQDTEGRFSRSGTLGKITINDKRTASKPGWEVTANVTPFTHADGNAVGTIDQKHLGWVPSVTSGTGITVGAAQQPGSGTAKRVLGTAPAGSGVHTSELSAALNLLAPANTPKGDYGSKVTLTLTSK